MRRLVDEEELRIAYVQLYILREDYALTRRLLHRRTRRMQTEIRVLRISVVCLVLLFFLGGLYAGAH